jgi:hypothetical protein
MILMKKIFFIAALVLMSATVHAQGLLGASINDVEKFFGSRPDWVSGNIYEYSYKFFQFYKPYQVDVCFNHSEPQPWTDQITWRKPSETGDVNWTNQQVETLLHLTAPDIQWKLVVTGELSKLWIGTWSGEPNCYAITAPTGYGAQWCDLRIKGF